MIKISTGHIIALVAGAAIGSAVTYKIAKDNFAKRLETEIENMREYYLGVKTYGEEEVEEPKSEEVEEVPPTQEEVDNIMANFNYGVYQESGEGLVKKKPSISKPYVIPPDLFGDNEEYDTETLTYYEDGVLTDDQDNPIEDIQGMVGYDSLLHFGEYEKDAVYVRNDRHKTDYEILLDNSRYEDLKAEEYD